MEEAVAGLRDGDGDVRQHVPVAAISGRDEGGGGGRDLLVEGRALVLGGRLAHEHLRALHGQQRAGVDLHGSVRGFLGDQPEEIRTERKKKREESSPVSRG